MGRSVTVIVVLMATGFLVSQLVSCAKTDRTEKPGTAQPKGQAQQEKVATPAKESSAEVAPATPAAESPPGESKSGESKSDESESGKSAEATPAEGEQAATSESKEQAAVPASKVSEPQTVMLGAAELTAGIPGAGELTLVQIDSWLKDPKQHVVLKPELPPGLAAGAGQITGLDANPLTRAKIELGRQLYFDKRLSSDGTVSCASCHDPQFGYAFNTQFGVGIDGQTGNRNSPVAYNRILSGPQFWDGRAESLEAQAVGPIANPIEMGNTHEACVVTVKAIEGYRKQFVAIFGEEGVTIDNIGRALATFERVLVTGPSPWDAYQQLADFEKAYADDIADLDELKKEDEQLYSEYQQLKEASAALPISPSAIHGGELFFGDQGGCTACHVGANFTDEKYHNLGVGMDKPADKIDWGRFEVTKDDKDRGAFKTPTVRNITLTAPYMHDGSQ